VTCRAADDQGKQYQSPNGLHLIRLPPTREDTTNLRVILQNDGLIASSRCRDLRVSAHTCDSPTTRAAELCRFAHAFLFFLGMRPLRLAAGSPGGKLVGSPAILETLARQADARHEACLHAAHARGITQSVTVKRCPIAHSAVPWAIEILSGILGSRRGVTP